MNDFKGIIIISMEYKNSHKVLEDKVKEYESLFPNYKIEGIYSHLNDIKVYTF